MRIISEGRKYFRLCGTCCPLQVSRSINLLTLAGGKVEDAPTADPPKAHQRVSLRATALFLFCITEWEQALQQYLSKTRLSEIYMNLNMSWNAPYKSSDQDSLHHWVKMSHNIHNVFVWKKKKKNSEQINEEKNYLSNANHLYHILFFSFSLCKAWTVDNYK